MAAKKPKIENIRGRFGVIIADPPWRFKDQLSMSDVKRGSSSQYGTMGMEALKKLPIVEVAAEDALLALWVPSALLTEGLEIMRAWGFTHKQVYTWVKTAQHKTDKAGKKGRITEYDGNGLAFGMGHKFRNCTENALIGTRGSPDVLVRTERNVELHLALRHSAKPEGLSERLERMLGDVPRLELFARRDRPGWVCTGKECPSTYNQDIQTWLAERLVTEAVA